MYAKMSGLKFEIGSKLCALTVQVGKSSGTLCVLFFDDKILKLQNLAKFNAFIIFIKKICIFFYKLIKNSKIFRFKYTYLKMMLIIEIFAIFFFYWLKRLKNLFLYSESQSRSSAFQLYCSSDINNWPTTTTLLLLHNFFYYSSPEKQTSSWIFKCRQ